MEINITDFVMITHNGRGFAVPIDEFYNKLENFFMDKKEMKPRQEENTEPIYKGETEIPQFPNDRVEKGQSAESIIEPKDKLKGPDKNEDLIQA